MRLYAFLLVAGAALCARAASIPVENTEKKIIDTVPDNFDKLSENISSEQELIDQANTIKDVDNKLRTKPEVIPVEVIVEKVEPAFIADDENEQEIKRPEPDLRNPGPPQRQEHETQNPEYYSSEQQTVALFKQSINEAQNVLRQGFQGITDGIQSVIATNEPIQTLQLSIQSLRDGFTAQMIKVNETIQSYLNTESIDKPAAENTKAGFHAIEQGLFRLRNDFNKGVSTLSSGVEIAAALRADNETPDESSGASAPASPAPASPAPTPAPVYPFLQFVNNMQASFSNTLQNFTDSINRFTQGQTWPFSQSSSTPVDPAVPAGVQSDSQATSNSSTTGPTNFIQNINNQFQSFIGSGQPQTQGPPGGVPGMSIFQPQPGQFGSGSGILANAFNNFVNYFQPKPTEGQGTQPAPAVEPAKPATVPESKPEAQEGAAEPVESSKPPAQAAAVIPPGPIRQILQKNPITVGIAGAVQRLQNINNPEKPRDEQIEEQVKKLDEDKAESESKKGGSPNTGDNNDSSNSSNRVEQIEEVKEKIEKVPEVVVSEVQKASEDKKTEEVVDKTE